MNIYADYDFYVNDYRNGSTPVLSESDFTYYALRASQFIRNLTNEKSETYTGEEIKYATCACAETIYNLTDSNSSNATPVGVASESIGDYSVSYGVSSIAERSKEVKRQMYDSVEIWLETTGLLYRGIDCYDRMY